MSILDRIIDQKKVEIEKLKKVQFHSYKNKRSSFIKAFNNQKLNLIAEVKQASPSRGIIYTPFLPMELATSFEENGAACLSVLTDEYFFKGHKSYLITIKKNAHVPVLRKDFIIDPLQVLETNEMGADAMLIILDILSINQANELIHQAKELGIDVLIEIHSEASLDKLNDIAHKPLVGINNRDLTSFECDKNRAIKMSKKIRQMNASIKIIAESGYTMPEEMDELEKEAINGVLIGEGLSKNKGLLEWFKNEN